MFRNERKLGEGGFGQVYLGKHLVTGEEFAIKVMMPHNI
jgi:serine/threonine protein kinase